MGRPRVTNPDQSPWETCHVYRILRPTKGAKTGQRRYALIWGWPTPVSELARTQMPPLPGRPSYCREARQWAWAQLDANKARNMGKKPKAQRKWLGPITLRWLRQVHRGEAPLRFRWYHSLRTYWAEPVKPEVRLTVRLGGPVTLGWQAPRPPAPLRLHRPGLQAPDGGGFVPQAVPVEAGADGD